MPKSVETTEGGVPASGDRQAYRHFGDGTAGDLVASRVQGYDSSTLAYVDVAVDSNGNLKLAADVAVTIGTVDQGAPGASPWKVTDSALAALTDGTLRVGGTVSVTNTGTFAVQASLAAETTKVIGTVNQGTSPWVTSRNWALTSADQVTVANSSLAVTGTFWQATQPVSGTVTAANTGFNVTGTDGVTAGVAATVKTYNGSNVMFTRDPATLSLLSDILAELYELNTNLKELQ